MDDKQREAQLRERLRTRGFDMRKSQGAAPPGNQGKFMVFDPVTGASLLGHRFDADLDDIERWLAKD